MKIFFKKLTLLLLILMILVTCMKQNMYFKMSLMGQNMMTVSEIVLSIQMSKFQIAFMLMVLTITAIVLKYSENYMKFYNNKKFFMILKSFFFSMIILASSNSSMMTMMTGWEFLGLTSVFLILFYPKMSSLSNSMMTMTYNRMGDILMIMMLSLCLLNQISGMKQMTLKSEHLMMLIVCSMTKSAQIPLSSWLPAAMSAPTPISAMVHSSTLVTAGIFLTMTMKEELGEMMPMLTWISLTSFLLGGFMAMMEMDLKKTIAFSTMSQISMIMAMNSLNLTDIALNHMIYHALFKATLFCAAGYIFSQNWGSQNSKTTTTHKKYTILTLLMLISVFSMTGLMFSASFFTKDYFLEHMMKSNTSNFMTVMIMMAALCTMLYSMKIMKTMTKEMKMMSMESSKILIYMFMNLALTMMILEKLTKVLSASLKMPMLNSEEYKILLLIMMLAMMSKNLKMSKNWTILTMELMSMKVLAYKELMKPLKFKKVKETVKSDIMFMKYSTWDSTLKKFWENKSGNLILITMSISIMYFL